MGSIYLSMREVLTVGPVLMLHCSVYRSQTFFFDIPQKKPNVKCQCLHDQYRTKKASQLLVYQIFFICLPFRTFISDFLVSRDGMLHTSASPICVFVALTRPLIKGASLVAFCCQAKYYAWICVFVGNRILSVYCRCFL